MALVRLEGFEPPTLGSEDRCSNPLSYSRSTSATLIDFPATTTSPARDRRAVGATMWRGGA